MGLLGAFPALGQAVPATPAPTSSPVATSTPGPAPGAASTPSLSLSPEEAAKILAAVDAQSNTPPAQATPAPPPIGPLTVPGGLSVLTLKEGVYLSWESPPPGSRVMAYNVYRSTTPGLGYQKVNSKPLTTPYFLDGPPNSQDPPRNGEDYFYVAASLDAQGNLSPYSEEIAVTPSGMEIARAPAPQGAATPAPKEEEKELNVPERGIVNLQLPAESQLSIQGYKKLEAQLNFQKFDKRADFLNGQRNFTNTQNVNQELVVNLDGKVGKNVDVHVDFSDVNREGLPGQSKQEISIVYHGNQDSPVQEVSFGDLVLALPNTEFAGFSKQLFGIQAKVKVDRFRFTSFFAQTKGIVETKTFRGNAVQVDKFIQDIEYMRFKYFLITKDYGAVTLPSGSVSYAGLPQPGSEQIWVDPGNGVLPPSGPNFIGYFERYLSGRDYTIDYFTGVITFLRGISNSSRIAVGFRRQDGTTVGFTPSGVIDMTPGNLVVDPNGFVSDTAHLIKDNNNGSSVPSAITLSPLYLVDYFSLGSDKLIPPQQDPDFLFQIVDQGTGNVVQTGQPTGSRWNYQVNQDFNFLTVVDATNLSFPERAFANPDGGTGPNEVYSQTTTPNSLYRIHLKYKTQLNFFRLDQLNIIRGSESVFLDGRRLRRDADYFIDYTTGFLDFQDKSILRPDSVIVVTYEYAPFGAFSQNNILGARAEYDVDDHLFLGSTFLSSGAQQPLDVPQVGSTPNSLTLLDADARYDITPEMIQSVTGLIPGLSSWTPPLSLHLSGEVAQSRFNPNTFNAEGENGVAMVDNMEGIDSVTGPSMNASSWISSAAPQPVAFLGSVAYVSAPAASNNRVRFRNGGDYFNVNITNGGHLYYTESTPNINDKVSVLSFPYANLTDQRWGGVRQILSQTGTDISTTRFFQTWIFNDGNPKWIMFDFGILDEDTQADGALQQEYDRISNTFYDNGIPTYYFDNPTAAIGGGTGPQTLVAPTDEGYTQEGARNGVHDTEDINGNGVEDHNNNYFEYGVEANWKGWRQVKIPVNFSAGDSSSTTPDGTNFFFHVQGAPNPQIIQAVRVWITGTSSTALSGSFLLENISFTRNLWQLQVDPDASADQGVTINTSKFDVNSVSRDQNPNYDATLRFINVSTGQNTSSILEKEKSLKVTYNLSNADYEPVTSTGKPVYYATRYFPQGMDFTDYQDLGFDLEIRSFNPGEILFIRLANDQKNYFQYNFPLTSAYQNLWKTVALAIDGSQGNRIQAGSPILNRITQIQIGVLSPNPPVSTTQELWINNLRATNSAAREGIARRANAEIKLGEDFAVINTRYREVDSGFSQMDQTSTRFQHNRQAGADFSSSSIKLFSEPIVTQFSYTQEDRYTEDALLNNPYYLTLPNSNLTNATGTLSYAKDLGPNIGRLTNLRLAGSANTQSDSYQAFYLAQPGVQGNTRKGQENVFVSSTYDAPPKIFILPIGSNQFNQSFSLTHDTQRFDFNTFSPYDRTTRVQTYGWTNTTELLKDLVFTPGYTWTLTDAVGNTNSPGQPGTVGAYTPFQQRHQPRAGLVYRGFSGATPSVDYSGSEQLDYVSFQGAGTRFNNANNLNYSLNLTPGAWIPMAQKIGLSVYASRTESSNAAIQNYRKGSLNFDQEWLMNTPVSQALNSTNSTSNQVNGSFKLFDFWDFRPTGTWTTQKTTFSQNSPPVEQDGRTLSFTTVWNRKILSVPFIDFSLDSAEFQYTLSENFQSASGVVDNRTYNDTFVLTIPYDIAQKGQGNIRLQRTQGLMDGRGTFTYPHDDIGSIEYNQKFLQNQYLHIPFTNWKIKFDQALEARATYLMEFVDTPSDYVGSKVKTQRYRGSLTLNYNALKNLRLGLGAANEHFDNTLYPEQGYTLWQVTISAEARF